jgi:hypothetical protein
MPNPGADRPLQKVTLNLYEEDVRFLQSYEGWTQIVRATVHEFVKDLKVRQGYRSMPYE